MKSRDLLSNALTVLVTLAISCPLVVHDHKDHRYKVINLGTLGGTASKRLRWAQRPRLGDWRRQPDWRPA